MKKIIFVCLTLLSVHIAYTQSNKYNTYRGNNSISSFNKAKKILHHAIFYDHRKTLYCNCTYNHNKKIDWLSCGYKYRKNLKRAKRLEWEHVVPAHAFGQSFAEWSTGHELCVNKRGKKYKGRRCAQKVNLLYRHMQADMYNLFPAVGEINGDRSNYSMAIIQGEMRNYGMCDCEIKNKKIEPRPEIRGDIARIYMYMHTVYPGRDIISKKNKRLFTIWNKKDPVDTWECERVRRIAKIQKNRNTIVEKACRANYM